MGADRRQTSWPKAQASVPLLGHIPAHFPGECRINIGAKRV